MGAIAQIAADLAAAAMSALLGKDPGIPPAFGALMMGAPTVLIGGFPCPNLPNPLDALMHGLKCVSKAVGKSKGFGKLLNKVGLCNSPGEPIHPLTGEVYNDFEDYKAQDTGFAWKRHYRSGWNEQDGVLGFGFRHFLQRTLTFLRKRAIYEAYDNEVVALQKLEDGSYAPRDGHTLTSADGRRFTLTTERGETLLFELQPTSPASARLIRYTAKNVDAHLYYESNGRLRALSEHPLDQAIDTHFQYDARGRIERVLRGPRGHQPTFISEYGYENGCMVEWRDACGAAVRMRYDGARRMVQGTDRRGYSFHWQYDGSGRCIKSHGDDGLWGGEAAYAGSTSTFTEPDGGVWTYKHYPDGKPSHVVDPLGGVKFYEQDASGRIVKQTDRSGTEYVWLYDERGAHYGRRDPWGTLVGKEDDDPEPQGPLEHFTPTTQRAWHWGRHRLPARLQGLPSTVQLAFQQLGPIPFTNPLPPPAKDALGRVLEQRHPNGALERWVRDPNGNVTAHQDANGNWDLRQIHSWDLTAAERSPMGSVTAYEHTHREAVRALTDPNGNRTEYLRDRIHRVCEERRRGRIHRRYVFGASDVATEARDDRGQVLFEREVAPGGLPTKIILASGETYTYRYDQRGKRIEASSSLHRVEQQHAQAGILLDKRDGQGVTHSCDELGRIRLTRYFDRFIVRYERDPSGMLVIATPEGSLHRFWATQQGTFVRELGNGTKELTAYDFEERLAARVCWAEEHARFEVGWGTRYVYGSCGELLEIRDSETGLTTLAYDADQRLLTQDSGGRRTDYRYDLAGNLTFAPDHYTIENEAGNMVRSSQAERFEYDELCRISRRIQPRRSREVTYFYDCQGQLVEARFSDRAEVWRSAYDGLGRRLYRECGQQRTEFFWDGDRLAAEIGPDGRLRIYVYTGHDALVPCAFIDYASAQAPTESGSIYYLFCAPNGMPLRVEDATRAIVWSANSIGGYGVLEVDSRSTISLRLRFAGHFYDEDLELFYNRYRDYDPTLARYLQPDPIGHEGSLNLYAYPANPLVDVDLLGLMHSKKPRKSREEHGSDWGVDPATGKAIKPRPDLTPHQEAELKRRRERYEAEGGKMGDAEWREHGYRANANRDSSHPREEQALKAVGAKPNNASAEAGGQNTHTHHEYRDENGRQLKDEHGKPIRPKLDEQGNPIPPHPPGARVSTETTRPDGTRGKDVVEHKNMTGGEDTLDDSQQMRAQREMAEKNGGKHEVAMTSDKPMKDDGTPPVKPSSTVGSQSDVKYVDDQGNVTHTWDDGRWKPVTPP
jgi:RHS repeat-associated protein